MVLPHPRVSIRTHALAEPASGRDYSRTPRRASAGADATAGPDTRGNAPGTPGVAGDADTSIAPVGGDGGGDAGARPMIGVFGPGKGGPPPPRLLVAAGYDVLITGSARQTALDLLV